LGPKTLAASATGGKRKLQDNAYRPGRTGFGYLPLDRSEHFDEKQHGGYGTSFYIRLKTPFSMLRRLAPNVLAAYLTARRLCKGGWYEDAGGPA